MHNSPLLQIYIMAFFIPYFILFGLFAMLIARTLQHRRSNLPLGPWNLPIIGSLHHLLGAELAHHKLWDVAKIHGPIMHLRLGQISTVVVTSGKVAKDFFKNHEMSIVSRPVNIMAANVILYRSVDMLFAPYGEYYTKVRRLFVTELMSPKRVQSYQAAREMETMDLMRTVESCHHAAVPVNFTELFHAYINNLIARVAFGKRSEHDSVQVDSFADATLDVLSDEVSMEYDMVATEDIIEEADPYAEPSSSYMPMELL